jgi:hypothetical protein
VLAKKYISTYDSRVSDNFKEQHPYKLLRGILKISQQRLAEVIGISTDSIGSAEIGRRAKGTLTSAQREQVQATTGAIWDPHLRQWFFDPGGFANRRAPYLREHFDTYRAELNREARQRAEIIYYLMLKTYFFSASIPDAGFNTWFWRLEQQFDRWSEEFGLKHKIEFSLEPLWDSEQSRTVGFRKFFPTLLNGEGDEEVFAKVLEEARKGRLETIAALYPRVSGKVFSKSDLLKPMSLLEEHKLRPKRQKTKKH